MISAIFVCTKSWRIWSKQVNMAFLKGSADGFSYFSMILSYLIF